MRRRLLLNEIRSSEVKGRLDDMVITGSPLSFYTIARDDWRTDSILADLLEEEAEFNWEEYMEETGAAAAPHTAFKHVSSQFDLHL